MSAGRMGSGYRIVRRFQSLPVGNWVGVRHSGGWQRGLSAVLCSRTKSKKHFRSAQVIILQARDVRRNLVR